MEVDSVFSGGMSGLSLVRSLPQLIRNVLILCGFVFFYC